MAIISTFYGLVISMFYDDNKKHKLPHLHVRCQNFKAVLSIPDGELIKGSLPQKKLKLVRIWISQHKEELMENWELSINGKKFYSIEPLKK